MDYQRTYALSSLGVPRESYIQISFVVLEEGIRRYRTSSDAYDTSFYDFIALNIDSLITACQNNKEHVDYENLCMVKFEDGSVRYIVLACDKKNILSMWEFLHDKGVNDVKDVYYIFTSHKDISTVLMSERVTVVELALKNSYILCLANVVKPMEIEVLDLLPSPEVYTRGKGIEHVYYSKFTDPRIELGSSYPAHIHKLLLSGYDLPTLVVKISPNTVRLCTYIKHARYEEFGQEHAPEVGFEEATSAQGEERDQELFDIHDNGTSTYQDYIL